MGREDPTARKGRFARERFARWRVRQSQESLNRRHAADNECLDRRREGETPEEGQNRLAFLSEYRERIHLVPVDSSVLFFVLYFLSTLAIYMRCSSTGFASKSVTIKSEILLAS
ncbi:hypothetical protein AVEN_218534-1 [Araneus ventricosus]|uniref:Uncharacterized protein n=1 Tax=Araneus ventricosus TaxID=182803 RepID=A0A4Y2S0M9_ARAVE|nr:hypothetical protein AVEN_218534-1 [Araneus ventricosus]